MMISRNLLKQDFQLIFVFIFIFRMKSMEKLHLFSSTWSFSSLLYWLFVLPGIFFVCLLDCVIENSVCLLKILLFFLEICRNYFEKYIHFLMILSGCSECFVWCIGFRVIWQRLWRRSRICVKMLILL